MTEIYPNFIWRPWKILIFWKFIFSKNFKFQDHCMYLGRKEEQENVLRKKIKISAIISSVQSSRSVVSNYLWLHGLQHARPPCPSSTPRVYSNSCPLNHWCHPTISSSVIPFFSCPQSFPGSGFFQMSQYFTSGSQQLEFQIQHQSFQWIIRTDFH